MKIVHLTPYYLPHVGGVERHLQLLNRELIARGHEVSVITQHLPGHVKLKEDIEGVHVARLDVSASAVGFVDKSLYKLRLWWQLWQHRQLLFDADRIHVHDVFFWIIPLLLMIPKRKRFITFHGYEGNEAPSKTQIFWHRFAEAMTTGNICVGAFHRMWYGVCPTIETHGAVDSLPRLVPSRKKNTGIYIGRLAEDTGVMEYLKALMILSKKGKKIQLDIYGDGPQREEAEHFVRRHRLRVTFHGNTPNAAKFLGQYQFACVSRYLAILESLSAQTPIIAQYNNPIKHDYLRLAPFAEWIDIVHTPHEVAERVANLTSRSSQSQRSTAAGKRWADAQTWQQMADHYETLWGGKR